MMFRILLCGILAASLGLAQRGGGGRGGGSSPTEDSFPRGATNRLDMFANMLQLNKDQKKDVKSILDDGQKEAAPIRENMTKSRESIAAAVQAGKGQEEIDPLVKSYAAVETQMTECELKAFAKIVKDLDNDQKTQLSQLYRMIRGIFVNTKSWNSME